MSKNQQQDSEQKLTSEQIAQIRKNAITHYTEEIKFLEVQNQYEQLQADIEEHRLRKIIAIAQQSQFFSQDEETEERLQEEAPAPPAKSVSRKLKKTE